MNTNTQYNPFFRATRLALAELTTPEARRWYWQQLQTSAVLAQRITLQGVTVARRWISASRGQVAVVEPVQTDASASGLTDAEASTVDEQQQEHEAIEAVAEATDLELQPAPTAWAATDEVGGAADDYELLEDCDDIPTAEDEPLAKAEASEADTSFYEPEPEAEDATDGLTHKPEAAAQPQEPCFDTAQQPSRLSLLIQEFKRQKAESSAEMVGEDGSVDASNASAGAAAFAWEDTPAEGDSEAAVDSENAKAPVARQ